MLEPVPSVLLVTPIPVLAIVRNEALHVALLDFRLNALTFVVTPLMLNERMFPAVPDRAVLPLNVIVLATQVGAGVAVGVGVGAAVAVGDGVGVG